MKIYLTSCSPTFLFVLVTSSPVSTGIGDRPPLARLPSQY